MCRYLPQSLAVPGAPSRGDQDIPDPLYDDNSGLSEAQRLHLVIKRMQSACEGLLQHLVDLQDRYSSSRTWPSPHVKLSLTFTSAGREEPYKFQHSLMLILPGTHQVQTSWVCIGLAPG